MEMHRKLIDMPCLECGKPRKKRPTSDPTVLCRSCSCSKKNTCKTGDKNGNWKGGRHIGTKGYVMVRTPDWLVEKHGVMIYEHQLVMSEHLKRALLTTESVHHKNGVKTDNRIENLEVWSNGHPSGQRINDLIEWIVKTYPEEVKKKLGL